MATLILLFLFLHGWQRDFRVPMFFSNDALEYLMQAKGTIENGWWWVHPRLSAPGSFSQVLYPSNTNVDQAIVWVVHWFSRNPALCLNVSWMLMVALSAVFARRCLMLLSIRRSLAGPIGVLFALTPYALYLQPLFALAIYLLPFPCTMALVIATNRLPGLRPAQIAALSIGCVLVAFNYTYYAFFSCFLILVATCIAYARERDSRVFGRGLGVVALICFATAVNLAPSWYAWHTSGKPLAIPVKHVGEADQYGLKIRHLVSPVFDHSLPPFAQWNAREQAEMVPDEGEPKVSRLGLVATCGFMMLLGVLFTSRVDRAAADATLLLNASRLALAAVLLGTVGGFGSLFNLFVSPDIRAYSRLTPFIAFFSLVALALLAERWYDAVARPPGRWVTVALSLVFLLGMYDQSRAAAQVNFVQAQNDSEWKELSGFVQTLETRVPGDALVFQLPVLTFLNEVGRERMMPLDHIKPYLVSNHLHWSYPALTDSIVQWQQSVGRLPADLLAAALVQQRFSVIVVDRYGYADHARSLLDQFGVSHPSDAVLVDSERYIALDVHRLAKPDALPGWSPTLGAMRPATSGVPECAAPTAQYLEWVADEAAPFVRRPLSVSLTGDFLVSGWAVDKPHQQVAADIDIVIDGHLSPAFYGIDRADVARALGSANYRASGFTGRLLGADVGAGTHVVSVRILSADRRCFYKGSAIPVSAH